MPLYKTITVNPTTQVYIWKVEESLEELSKGVRLTPHCSERITHMKSQIHQRGFMSIRHLLNEAGYVDHDLYYDAFGKPHLKDDKHISITHSYNFTAIIVSDIEVGIDIEKQREKILKTVQFSGSLGSSIVLLSVCILMICFRNALSG